ncbi:MAG: discoidin domain-containing protein [Bacillota bacterium]
MSRRKDTSRGLLSGVQALVLISLMLLTWVPATSAQGSALGLFTNMSLGRSYTYSMPPMGNYTDPKGSKLTDGSFKFSWGDMVGWADVKQNPVVTIDLGKVHTGITRISGHFMRSYASAVNMPKKLVISISDDNSNFRPVGEAISTWPDPILNEFINEVYWENGTQPASGRYVRIEIDQTGNGWVMPAELTVWAGELLDYINASRGRSYKLTVAPAANYPDNGWKLTDGLSRFAWGDMVGWDNPGEPPAITVDLGDVVDGIFTVSGQFMRSEASAVMAPAKMIVYVSDDNKSFTRVGEATTWRPGPAQDERVNELVWENKANPVNGRFVKVEVVPAGTAWTMLAEITVGVRK